MHAYPKLTGSLGEVLRYHERKVRKGQAECLYAGNMLKEAKALTLNEKRFFIERLESLNDRVVRKTLHIFLSFHKDDILDDAKMRMICKEYMDRMGLGKHPYLVYRHWDAVHAHAHIVSTSIRKDGRRMDLWQQQFFQSLSISRELEKKYGLYQAGKRVPNEEWARKHPAQKIVYGKTPLRPTMNAVLERVLDNYTYTSLEELNALLRGYNLVASRGSENSVTHRRHGLLYYPLKASGKKEDVYIKASALSGKPTLRNLELRFAQNLRVYEEKQQRVKTAIDWVFYKQPVDMEAFRKALLKDRIRVIDGGASGEGVFYLDEGSKAIYDGRTLGPAYSVEGVRARCIPEEEYRKVQELDLKQELRQRPRLGLH